ncbi:unnamed protein product [Protopolystoma xenopodis]|uniref:Uncharacterized protein n=1 Tax=Protopolystoma xenopodis TaxID=117903 RepID=A0A3S5CCR3_9PLAT|nr:unnamed protein product [Protopolystoma xenopodis]
MLVKGEKANRPHSFVVSPTSYSEIGAEKALDNPVAPQLHSANPESQHHSQLVSLLPKYLDPRPPEMTTPAKYLSLDYIFSSTGTVHHNLKPDLTLSGINKRHRLLSWPLGLESGQINFRARLGSDPEARDSASPNGVSPPDAVKSTPLLATEPVDGWSQSSGQLEPDSGFAGTPLTPQTTLRIFCTIPLEAIWVQTSTEVNITVLKSHGLSSRQLLLGWPIRCNWCVEFEAEQAAAQWAQLFTRYV